MVGREFGDPQVDLGTPLSIDVNGCPVIGPKDYYKSVGRKKQVMISKAIHAAMEAMEAESEGKIHISQDLRVYQRWRIPRSIYSRNVSSSEKVPVFQGACRRCFLLYWWHVLCQYTREM